MASTDDAVDDVVEHAPAAGATDVPAHRYTRRAGRPRSRTRWQDRWDAEDTFEAPNPAGPLADPERVAGRPKLYVLDMFPYPSGAGLHVGHPLGYIGTDVYGRYKRMTGHNVLHTLGYDAFGLPAEQYAVADRHAPPGHHRGEHRQLPPPAAPARPGPRPAPQRRHHRRVVLPLDAVDLPADLQRPGTTASRTGPGRSPSWAPSSSRRHPADARRPAVGGAVRARAAPRGRRPPPGLPRRGAGQLVPGPGHRAGQRGGHRRRPRGPRQLPRLPRNLHAVDDADHGLRRPADRRPRPRSTGPSPSR